MGVYAWLKNRISTKSSPKVIHHPHIRDFIYLDIERIRSYISQVYGGLTIERTSRLDQSDTIQSNIAVTLPFKAGIDVSKYITKSDTETKSLHDQIFDQFYQALILTNSLRRIYDGDSFKWEESLFNDGVFVSVKAVITITDYTYVRHFAENLSKISSMLYKTISSSSNIQQKKQADNTLKDVQRLPTKEIAGLIDEFYGDMVRIDFFPFSNNTDNIFIGIADRSLFRRSLKDLLTCYGPTIDANWNAILQVNMGKFPKNEVLGANTGNEMDIAIKQVISSISSMLQVTQTIDFPAISVIPIAIFRDTSLG